MKSGMGCVGYARVSTEEQAREGTSLAMQADKIAQFAALHDLALVAIESDDGVSARTLKRPGLGRALARLDAGEAAGLVVYKLDRLTRSLRDWSALIEGRFLWCGSAAAGRKQSLLSVSESIDTASASGRMVLNLLVTVGQWERETTVERTRAAIDHKRSRGERISGRIPFGWSLAPDGVRLVVHPGEQLQLLIIRKLHDAGVSDSRIAADLERRGVATRCGGPWRRSTIRRLTR